MDKDSVESKAITTFITSISDSYYKALNDLSNKSENANKRVEKLTSLLSNGILSQMNFELFALTNNIDIIEDKVSKSNYNIALLKSKIEGKFGHLKGGKKVLEMELQQKEKELKSLEKRLENYKLERVRLVEQIDKVQNIIEAQEEEKEEEAPESKTNTTEEEEKFDVSTDNNSDLQLLQLFKKQLESFSKTVQ